MRVFYFDRIAAFDYKAHLSALSEERRVKTLRYRREIDRKLCAASYVLLCRALQSDFDILTPGRFSFNEYGKPYLAEHPDIHFNISHCEAGAVCAVSDSAVGADIQDMRPFTAETAKRVFSDEELLALTASSDRERMFARLWSRKEATLKMLGSGIAEDLRQVGTLNNPAISTRDFNCYVISVCGRDLAEYIEVNL